MGAGPSAVDEFHQMTMVEVPPHRMLPDDHRPATRLPEPRHRRALPRIRKTVNHAVAVVLRPHHVRRLRPHREGSAQRKQLRPRLVTDPIQDIPRLHTRLTRVAPLPGPLDDPLTRDLPPPNQLLPVRRHLHRAPPLHQPLQHIHRQPRTLEGLVVPEPAHRRPTHMEGPLRHHH